MENWIFRDPWWLVALSLLPLIAWARGRRRQPALVVPFAAEWQTPVPITFSRFPIYLAYLSIALIILALARPQKVQDKKEIRKEGYDLMLAVDLSLSMLAEDYNQGFDRVNRWQAIKPVMERFIQERNGDRIGLVVFAGRAYTLAPLTFDHAWLLKQIDRLSPGKLEQGTAVGDGLGAALTRLEQKSKTLGQARKGAFVILMTDGASNKGSLNPMQAAQIAVERRIPVYTIGAGSEGVARIPTFDQDGNMRGYRAIQSDLDEKTLFQVAQLTGGKYFRASDENTVKSAFAAIDQAKKIDFQAKSYLLTQEYFEWLLLPGFLIGVLAGLLALAPGSRGVMA